MKLGLLLSLLLFSTMVEASWISRSSLYEVVKHSKTWSTSENIGCMSTYEFKTKLDAVLRRVADENFKIQCIATGDSYTTLCECLVIW